MPKPTILDICGGTGAWSRPYAEAGYDVHIIDLPLDIRLMEISTTRKIHGILAAPPCTHLCASGARWWEDKGEEALLGALSMVDACLRAVIVYQPEWWALENPVGRLTRYLGKPALYFQPWEYGDPYTKKTCLWGNFTSPKKSPVEPTLGGYIHRLPPSPDRQKLRSITPQGFARAFFEANP